jgi:hypothetical protein
MLIAPLSSIISLQLLNIRGLLGERVYTSLAKSLIAFSSLSSSRINSLSPKKSVSSIYRLTTLNRPILLLLVAIRQGS